MKTFKEILAAIVVVCGGLAVVGILMFMWFAVLGVFLAGCGIMLAWHMLGFPVRITNTKTGETYIIKRFKRVS